MTRAEQVYRLMAQFGPLTTKLISEYLGLSVKSTRNILSDLKARGAAGNAAASVLRVNNYLWFARQCRGFAPSFDYSPNIGRRPSAFDNSEHMLGTFISLSRLRQSAIKEGFNTEVFAAWEIKKGAFDAGPIAPDAAIIITPKEKGPKAIFYIEFERSRKANKHYHNRFNRFCERDGMTVFISPNESMNNSFVGMRHSPTVLNFVKFRFIDDLNNFFQE